MRFFGGSKRQQTPKSQLERRVQRDGERHNNGHTAKSVQHKLNALGRRMSDGHARWKGPNWPQYTHAHTQANAHACSLTRMWLRGKKSIDLHIFRSHKSNKNHNRKIPSKRNTDKNGQNSSEITQTIGVCNQGITSCTHIVTFRSISMATHKRTHTIWLPPYKNDVIQYLFGPLSFTHAKCHQVIDEWYSIHRKILSKPKESGNLGNLWRMYQLTVLSILSKYWKINNDEGNLKRLEVWDNRRDIWFT